MDEIKNAKNLDADTLEKVSGGGTLCPTDDVVNAAPRMGTNMNMNIEVPAQPWYVAFGTLFQKSFSWMKLPRKPKNAGGSKTGI